MQEKTLLDQINIPTNGINHTREVVVARLGGPFDYTQFSEDLRNLMQDKEALERQFKLEALQPPDFGNKGPRVPDYDFSSSIFTKDLFSGGQTGARQNPYEEKMTTVRPAYLDQIVT